MKNLKQNLYMMYLALQIMKDKLTYDKVMSKFSKYKEQIDAILIEEDREDLISE